jgi:hypothetical protein
MKDTIALVIAITTIVLFLVCGIVAFGSWMNRYNTAPNTSVAPYIMAHPDKGAILFKDYEVSGNTVEVNTYWEYVNNSPISSFFGYWNYVNENLTIKLDQHAIGIESKNFRISDHQTLMW